MILKRLSKIFSKSDKNEKEGVSFDYDKWNRPRVGFPREVGILGSIATAGATYGGVKAGENYMNRKIAKESLDKSKKILINKVNDQISKGKITKEQAKKALSNPKKLESLLKKHGHLDDIVKQASKVAGPRIKNAKIIGGIAAGLPVGLGSLYVVGNEEYKNFLFKYGPRKVEVGQVKLVQKSKKKKK